MPYGRQRRMCLETAVQVFVVPVTLSNLLVQLLSVQLARIPAVVQVLESPCIHGTRHNYHRAEEHRDTEQSG